MTRPSVLTACSHEAKFGSKWDQREDFFTSRTGLPLLRGEDAFPVAEVIEMTEELRVTILAVADGVGGGHVPPHERYHAWNLDGQIHGVTSPRLAAELTISGLPDLFRRIHPNVFLADRKLFYEKIAVHLQNHWRRRARDFYDSGVILGTSEENIRRQSVFNYFFKDYIFGSTTLSLGIIIESDEQTRAYFLKWGDSPIFFADTGEFRFSEDLLSDESVIDSYLVYGAGDLSPEYPRCKTVKGTGELFRADPDAPLLIGVTSDAHCFDSNDAVRIAWAPFLEKGITNQRELSWALGSQRRKGRRGGSNGDDFSMAAALFNSPLVMRRGAIFDKF